MKKKFTPGSLFVIIALAALVPGILSLGRAYAELKAITIKSTKLTAKKVGDKAFTGTAAIAVVTVSV